MLPAHVPHVKTRARCARLQAELASYGAPLAAYRGRVDEALARVSPFVEIAVGIDDLQAFAPALLALANAERGLGHLEAAVDALERGIKLRGETSEANLSVWFLFEAVDIVTWLMPEAGPPLRARALAVMEALAASLQTDVQRGGTDAELRVRHGLHDTARHQLAILAGQTDPAAAAAEILRAAGELRVARRVFDSACAELWAAEATRDAAAASPALATFEPLRAGGYVQRARAVMDG